MTATAERASDESVVLAARLADPDHAVAASSLGASAPLPNEPGLYAWWADEPARATLAEVLWEPVPALIYAGQAGASSPRAARPSRATLRSRIRSNHLAGNIGSSTFRRTLCALLREPLELEVAAGARLEPDSNARLSAWIAGHLSVCWLVVSDRPRLRDLEEAVLAVLDPPLNLQGMAPTPSRRRLRTLRAELTATPPV